MGRDRINRDEVLRTTDGRNIRIVCQVEINVYLDVLAHMAFDALIANADGQSRLLWTRGSAMAIQTTFLKLTANRRSRQMRVVARDAGHLALLKTL